MANIATPDESRHSRQSPYNMDHGSMLNALAEIEKLRIAGESGAPTNQARRDESKENWKRTLSYLDIIASSLCTAANAIPTARAFKVLIQMEHTRHDHCPQVVDQCHSIGRTLVVFGVSRNSESGSKDDVKMKTCLGEIEALIEEFANFAKLYYAERKHSIFRLWHAEKLRAKLESFQTHLERSRTGLIGSVSSRAQYEEDEIKWSERSNQLRALFGKPSSQTETQASAFIEKWGRDVILKDPAKLNDLANLLNERIDSSVQSLLQAEIDALLQSRMEMFHRQFESSIADLGKNITHSRDSIRRQSYTMPHEMISDPDIREVWKTNNWKLTVKGRHFVEELSNYLEEKSRTLTPSAGVPPDSWTLPIISRATYYPAIGDAIEEDGSGFITLHEVEAFSKQRPAGVSLPEWLAYWAVGWRMNSLRYNSEVLAALDTIGETCRKTARMSRIEGVRQAVRDYLRELEAFRNIAAWADPSDAIECNGLPSSSNIVHLQELSNRVGEQDIKDAQKRWEDVNWKVDEPSNVPFLFHSSDGRIEQNFLCVANILLEHQRGRVTVAGNLEDGDWSEMAETLRALGQVFRERVRHLVQGWRAQKLDIDLQVASFRGGICAGWYTMYGQSYRDARRNISFVDMSPGATPLSPIPQNVASQLNDLGERVDRLERIINERMDTMQTNMASILRDVLISDIMHERGMTSPTASFVSNPTTTGSTAPNRFSKPVINVDIPSVTFSEVMVNQNGSLHMNTPVVGLPDRTKRESGDTINGKRNSVSPSLTRSDSLAMSSFVQTANGSRYMGSYEDSAEEYSSAYTPSSSDPTEGVRSGNSEYMTSEDQEVRLSDANVNPFGLGTPTSMTFHSPQDQYYGGVMLISRGEHAPQLRIEPIERGGRLDNQASPPFLSSQSDAFMGRHAYDVPISAVPNTESDSGRSPRSSKASKQSVSSSGSLSGGSSTSGGGGSGGFRGGFKSVKESFRNIGGSSNGSKKKTPSGLSSPTSGSVTPRPPPYQQTQQGIIDVWAAPSEWQHANGAGAGGGNGSTGMMSPPLTTTTDRFNMTRRSPGSMSPPAGSGFARMASPFAYMQKLTGSQTRVGMTTGHNPVPGPSISPHDQSLGLGNSGVRGFGQHVAMHGTQGGGASSAMGLGLAQPAFGRPGHVAGPRSVDVATPARPAARWPNARRSRSIDGIGM